MDGARKMRTRGSLRPWTYYCLLGLLSVTGMRIGEARNLKFDDVDLAIDVLTIRGAKFGQLRLVPIQYGWLRFLGQISHRDKWLCQLG